MTELKIEETFDGICKLSNRYSKINDLWIDIDMGRRKANNNMWKTSESAGEIQIYNINYYLQRNTKSYVYQYKCGSDVVTLSNSKLTAKSSQC